MSCVYINPLSDISFVNIYVITYMWNLKKKDKQMNVTKQKQTHRYREQTSGYWSGDRWGEGKIEVGD